MKKAAEYLKKIKQLSNKLKKQGDKVTPAEIEEPMELLLFSILSNFSSEARAAAAVSKLQSAVVDYNELRVTPVAEIVEIIGKDYPNCRRAAEEIGDALHAVFNQLHDLNLQFLKAGPKRHAESFVSSLDNISPHARAMMSWRCLGGRAVPLDSNMYAYLVKNDYLPEQVDVEEAQKFLTSKLKDRDGENFYLMLKRYAATHAPRRTSTSVRRSAAAEQTATSEPEQATATATKPARKTRQPVAKRTAATAKSKPKPKTKSKKTATSKKTASKKTASRKTKTASRKTKTGKTRRKVSHK